MTPAARTVLAIDQGMTGSTCLVVSANGRVVGRGYREITQHFPQPGWVEHDANEIFERTVEAARDATAEARAHAVGLTRGTTPAHLARAALEAMAFSTLDILGYMRSAARVPITRLRVDGGATADAWLMQFQADVADIEVERPDMTESTALGAAGLAGIAAGIWPSAEEFTASRAFKRFVPGEGAVAAREAHKGWRRAVRATLSWARDES